MNICKFCSTEVDGPLSKGYCPNCYRYFVLYGYKYFEPSKIGSISYVKDETSKQNGWPICHICGMAFQKLQQHIYYTHHLAKNEYCDLFGLDHGIRLTGETYHNKMREHALANNMDEQLRSVGAKTRYKEGHNNKYQRSLQTQNRLANNKIQYNIKIKKKRLEAIEYIKSFDPLVQDQFIKTLNSPSNELNGDQLRLKCAILGYDLDRDVII